MKLLPSFIILLSISVSLFSQEPSLTLETERLAKEVAATALADNIAFEKTGKSLKEAGISLGTWHRIGPFRNLPPILNWMDNVDSSFAHIYKVEKDFRASGWQPNLSNNYPAIHFPTTPNAIRKWEKHEKWVDGYLCDLPRGPAPSTGEAQYIYRTITVNKDTEITLDFTLRSPISDRGLNTDEWRRTGRFTCWVNGEEIMQFHKMMFQPKRETIKLKRGENHFIAKLVNNRHSYGFTFAIDGLHPAPVRETAYESPWADFPQYPISEKPFYREKCSKTSDWFIKKETMLESYRYTFSHIRKTNTNKKWSRFKNKKNQFIKFKKDNRYSLIWKELYKAFPHKSIEISILSKNKNLLFNTFIEDSTLLYSEGPLLAIFEESCVNRLAELSGNSAEAIKMRFTNPRALVGACVSMIRYSDGLKRLMSLECMHRPMPGMESAVMDGENIITPMEKALQAQPESVKGKEHRQAITIIKEEADNCLDRIKNGNSSYHKEVMNLVDKIDGYWNKIIADLPPIIFLERPVYGYPANMQTPLGTTPSYIRIFDTKTKTVQEVYHDSTLRAHEINLSHDGKTVFIGGGRLVQSVNVDGKNYRKLTSGQSPTELPDGRIVFLDDVKGQSPCKNKGPRSNLFVCDSDGNHRKLVSANLTIDNHPQITNDGRVVFSRWDYGVNKNVFNRHGIWTQRPDGTGLDLFFGNTIIEPWAFYRPRQIPHRPEMVVTFSSHHNTNAGIVGLIWQGKGREATDGVGFQRISKGVAQVGDRPPVYSYQDPYPLNETLFLVSYGGGPERKTGMYLLDRFGNQKCIFESGKNLGIYCPQPTSGRPVYPVIPDRVELADHITKNLENRLMNDPDWNKKATMLLEDVYLGIEPEVKRGSAKYLAVMEQIPQDYPRGGAIGVGTIFYVNRFLGLVPIEEDGSAHFEVPALRSIYFHVLDKDGHMLMTQGSDFHAMPGETRSCIGCHEQRKNITAPPNKRMSVAIKKKAVHPKLPDWGTRGIIEYESVVQPVLDKYCISCHSDTERKGKLDLSGSRTTVYNMSYMELTDKALVHYTPGTGRTHGRPSNDYDEQSPLSRGSLLSKMSNYLQNPEHSGKEIPFDEQLKVLIWINSNVPFYSHYRQKSPTILEESAREELAKVYEGRCAECHDGGDIPDWKSGLNEHHIEVHAKPGPGQWGISKSGMRVRHLNLSKPESSAAILAPLSKEAGGWGICKQNNGKAVFANKNDPDITKIIEALSGKSVIHRDQPGVAKMIKEGKNFDNLTNCKLPK